MATSTRSGSPMTEHYDAASQTYSFPSGLVLPAEQVAQVYLAYSDRGAGLSAAETAARTGLTHD